MITHRLAGIRRAAPLVASAFIGAVALACTDEQSTPPVIPPSKVVREFTSIAACWVDAVQTDYGNDSSKVLVTFESGHERCYPALAAYGIDMADPLGVDTPQGTGRWQIAEWHHVANTPSGTGAATTYFTPDQVMIEFDPPVQAVEFYYSRLTPAGARWGGQFVDTDSMPVYAMSRTPGTLSYQTYDSEVLYSNVPSAFVPWSVWDHARLQAAGDYIQWLWFDGDAAIDNLVITRRTVPDTGFSVSVECSPAPVVRGQVTTCDASWTPTSIQASEIAFSWEFEGDSVRVFPAQPVGFPPPPTVDTAGIALTAWQGPAIHSGRVAVTGTWQGFDDSDTFDLTVSQRSSSLWGDLPVDTFPGYGAIMPNYSQPLSLVGLNVDSATQDPGLVGMIKGGPTATRVATGPNSGLWYNTAAGVRSRRLILINEWLSGGELARIIYSCPSIDTLTHRSFMALRKKNANCNGPFTHKSDSTAFLEGVLAHETHGQNGARGHQGQIELAAQSLATCGKVPMILERAVGGDSIGLALHNGRAITEGARSLAAASWHNHVYGNYSNAPFYQLVSGLTTAAAMSLVSAGGDMQDTALTATAPSFGCTRVY